MIGELGIGFGLERLRNLGQIIGLLEASVPLSINGHRGEERMELEPKEKSF